MSRHFPRGATPHKAAFLFATPVPFDFFASSPLLLARPVSGVDVPPSRGEKPSPVHGVRVLDMTFPPLPAFDRFSRNRRVPFFYGRYPFSK